MADISTALAPAGLLCELMENPDNTNIHKKRPGFGWVVKDEKSNGVQIAYQILVASSMEKLARDEGGCADLAQRSEVVSRPVHHAQGHEDAQEQLGGFVEPGLYVFDGRCDACPAPSGCCELKADPKAEGLDGEIENAEPSGVVGETRRSGKDPCRKGCHVERYACRPPGNEIAADEKIAGAFHEFGKIDADADDQNEIKSDDQKIDIGKIHQTTSLSRVHVIERIYTEYSSKANSGVVPSSMMSSLIRCPALSIWICQVL